MEGHGVILLLELKLLPAPPAACSGGSVKGELFLGFHLLKSTLSLERFSGVQKETKL